MSEVIEYSTRPKTSDRIRPKVIKWQNTSMIRTHSFRAAAQEIIDASDRRDVITASLIGPPHTGKSALARALAHEIHIKSKTHFNLRIFTKEDLMDFQKTIESLPPVNHILIFDDLSFLKSKYGRKLETVKQEFTEIRHFENRKDVKVICIYNFHYSPGFDKYLRQTDFKFWTQIGESEYDFVLKLFGTKHKRLIETFQKNTSSCLAEGHWHVRLNDKETFTYKYMNPFIPILFARGQQPRPIVTPTRQWLQGGLVCTICETAEGNKEVSPDFEKLCEQGEKNFGLTSWQSAIKITAHAEGKRVYGRTIENAITFLQKARTLGNYPTDQFLIKYDLKPRKIRLRHKPELDKKN